MLKRPLSFDDIPLVLTVEELMPILGVGRNVAYELVRSGQIKSTHIGKHARILKPDLQRFLEDGGTGTNVSWTDAAMSATLEGDSCRAAKGGNDDAGGKRADGALQEPERFARKPSQRKEGNMSTGRPASRQASTR